MPSLLPPRPVADTPMATAVAPAAVRSVAARPFAHK
jgi:hypothetical protein